MKKLFTLFLLFFFLFPTAYAGKEKTSKKARMTVKRGYKLTKQRYRLAYDKQWFLSLNKKQQLVYLKTISELSVKFARSGKFAFNEKKSYWDEFLELLMRPSYAVQRGSNIHNGIIHNKNFEAEIDSGKVYGNLFQGCPANQQPCSVTLGIAGTLSSPKINCANSTPNCSSSGNLELTRQLADKCKFRSDATCNVFNARYAKESNELEDYCEWTKSSRSKGLRAACDSAQASLRKAGINTPPSSVDAPKGANCPELSGDIVDRRERSRPNSGDSGHYNNNKFWRDTLNFARKACGADKALKSMTQIAGNCDVSHDGMTNSSGYKTQQKSRTIQKGKVTGAYYNTCLKNQELRRKNEFEREKLEIMGKSGVSSRERSQLLQAAEKKLQSDLAGFKSANTCKVVTESSTGEKLGDSLSISALSSGLMSRFEKNSMTTEDKRQFMAAFGMSPKNFRKVFCENKNFSSFKSKLTTFTNVQEKMVINPNFKHERDAKNQSDSAFYKMQKCAKNLKSVAESECEFKEIEDPYVIRSANSSQPLLARNMKTGKCLIVEDYSVWKVASDKFGADGKPKMRNVSRISVSDGKTGEGLSKSPAEFASEFALISYTCHNDPAPRQPSEVEYQIINENGEQESVKESSDFSVF